MPRQARTKSFSGIYHCILRGIDKQDIFLDNQDRRKFMGEIKKTKEKYEYDIYAYCLMDNHVHMLIRDVHENLSKIMQSLAVCYATYFNKKYERVGHLFQNRYFSKNVENQEYLLTLLRYIHQNPYDMERYLWSSYREFLYEGELVDKQFVLSLFADDIEKAKMEFFRFVTYRNRNNMLQDTINCEMVKELPDSQVVNIIQDITGNKNILKIKEYNKLKRDTYIKELLNIEGISSNQLARILGLNRKMIQRIRKDVSHLGQNVPEGNVPNGTKEVAKSGEGK